MTIERSIFKGACKIIAFDVVIKNTAEEDGEIDVSINQGSGRENPLCPLVDCESLGTIVGDSLIVLESWLIKHADGAQGQGDSDSYPLEVWLAWLFMHATIVGVRARHGQVHVRFASSWIHRGVVKQLSRGGKRNKRFHDRGVYTVEQHAIFLIRRYKRTSG